MSKRARNWLAIASIDLFVATMLGAWAAHGLERLLDADALSAFRTAVQYQFFHGLGLIGIALALDRLEASKPIAASAWLMLVGTFLFCGTIYVAVFVDLGALNLLTPVGGLCFMAGWLLLGFGALSSHGR